MKNTPCCNSETLDSFLHGTLSSSEEAKLTAHLTECEVCGNELESRAADAKSWTEVTSLLMPYHRQSQPHETQQHSASRPHQINQVLASLAPTDHPESLGRIGSHEVSGVIGSGGMGVVLKARDPSLDRVVAIKVLAPHLATSGSARKRFAREAKAAAAVLHPNVVAIHGVSNEETLPYLVMPFIRGQSLQKRIDSEGPLPVKDILRIGSQVAAGLAAAHDQGLVHRDIKPANILLEDGVERVAITDFGLARAVDDASMTRSGVIAGTPQYMSPEQSRGEVIDARSDLFSLGSLLYAMCTGHSPFRAETSFGVLHRISNDQPRAIREINSEIPDWLCRLIGGLHAKSPDDRFQSAQQVASLLSKCIAHVQDSAKPLPSELQSPRSHRSLVISGSVIAVLGIAGWILISGGPKLNQPAQSVGEHRESTAVSKESTEAVSSQDVETDWIEEASPSILDLQSTAAELREDALESFARPTVDLPMPEP